MLTSFTMLYGGLYVLFKGYGFVGVSSTLVNEGLERYDLSFFGGVFQGVSDGGIKVARVAMVIDILFASR